MGRSNNVALCFLCKSDCDKKSENLHHPTKTSNIPMIEILESLVDIKFEESFSRNWVIGCIDCIEKINQYDNFAKRASELKNQLVTLLVKIEEYPETGSFAEVAKSQQDFKLEIESESLVCSAQKQNDISSSASESETTSAVDNETPILAIISNAKNEEQECDGRPSPTESRTTKKIKVMKKLGTHGNLKCKKCKTSFETRQTLRDHRKMNFDCQEHYICDQCGATYRSKTALRAHVNMHTGENPIMCDICGKHFLQKGALNKHKFIHTGERPFQCSLCGKRFAHNHSLNVHQFVHNDLRPKQCHLCDKSFRITSHLNRHMLTHTRAKPHECKECGRKFACKYNLKQHLNSHFGIARPKKHFCTLCQRGFQRPGQLQDHLKSCSINVAVL